MPGSARSKSFDELFEALEIDRFVEAIIAAGAQNLDFELRCDHAGHGDNRHLVQSRVRSNEARH